MLFGEHAVVHGRPELLLAIDLYTQVGLRPSPKTRLNGDAGAMTAHPYFRAAMETLWSGREPLEATAISRLPRAAGLGSSAAFTSALATGLASASGGVLRHRLAEVAFSIERRAQGVGSPGDTSASVAGGYISLNGPGGERLWEVADEGHSWVARRIEDPGWVWLIGSTGVSRSTAEAVRAFGRRISGAAGKAALDEFERVAIAGIAAVGKGEREETGRLLNENQRLLRDAGVSHPKLEELLAAVAPVV
ncbi:MAG: hypothetical protein L3K09_05520, partial [Thermoplasmata archaeon]|nr:hypothetical protein [Thermoplasmata archaeon]